jgi:hypothetical protein
MTVVGFTGHQNIPGDAIEYVKEHVCSELKIFDSRTLVGMCSLADGADQLFAQLVLDAHGALTVIIPSLGYESTFADHGLRRYRQLLSHASETETLNWPEPSEDAFLAAGRLVAERSDVLMAVWDGQEAQGKGGTADIVRYAQQKGKPTIIIWPKGVIRGRPNRDSRNLP